MPLQENAAKLFETFVSSLRAVIIKERVSEAVSRATAEFCHSPFHAAGTPIAKLTRRHSRRRHRVAAKSAASSKVIRLSKNGKRIGRPPKVKGDQRADE